MSATFAEPGTILAERLGLEILGEEGNDVKCSCPVCGHKDGFRVERTDGRMHCYVCKAKDTLEVCERILGDKAVAMQLLIELGLRKEKTSPRELLEAVARIKRVSPAAIERIGGHAWMKADKLIIPQWGPDTLDKAKRKAKRVPCSKYFIGRDGNGRNQNNEDKQHPTGLFLGTTLATEGDSVALVEGPFELAATLEHLCGDGKPFTTAYGLPGTTLKKGFVSWFQGVHVFLAFDRDEGGDKGVQHVGRMLKKVAASVRVVQLPAEWTKKDGPGVRESLAMENGLELIFQAIEAAPEWEPKGDDLAGEEEVDETTHVEKYALTDCGNAERFRDRNLGRAAYCYAWNSWLTYDNKRWAVDGAGQVMQFAKETVRGIVLEAVDDENDPEQLFKHGKRSESAARLAAMLTLSQDELPIDHQQLDRHPHLFNAANGTIDLRTGKILPHDREHWLTKISPTEYDPSATSEVWEKFLSKTFNQDAELIAFVRRLFGYFLTGDVSEQILPIFQGSGSNGKSTLIEAFASAIGQDYCLKAVSNLLIAKRQESHPTEKADLFGRRFVYCVETSDGNRLDEALVKELTGGDRVRSRRMREDFWEFEPTHKLVLCTNHAPRVRDTGHAMWRRLVLVPFDVQFWNPDRGESGPEHLRQDKTLPAKLRQEAAGILAWAVRGCREWQENGLQIPKSVRLKTDEYKQSQDTIKQFIEECCEVGERQIVSSSFAWKAYVAWSNDRISQRKFSEAIKEHGFDFKKSGKMWITGMSVVDGLTPSQKKNDNDSESNKSQNKITVEISEDELASEFSETDF